MSRLTSAQQRLQLVLIIPLHAGFKYTVPVEVCLLLPSNPEVWRLFTGYRMDGNDCEAPAPWMRVGYGKHIRGVHLTMYVPHAIQLPGMHTCTCSTYCVLHTLRHSHARVGTLAWWDGVADSACTYVSRNMTTLCVASREGCLPSCLIVCRLPHDCVSSRDNGA